MMLASHSMYALANYDPNYKSNVFALWGGINDLLYTQNSPQQILDLLQTYWQNARNTGFKVLAFTITPCAVGGTENAVEESNRQTLNALIRQSSSNYDALADLGTDNRIGQSGDEFNSIYFYNDLIHMTDNGFQVVASIVETAIAPLL
jgi:hypothetical protein